MVAAPSHPPRVAFYLDTFLSRPLLAHVVGLCRDLGADILFLAPPPGDLAVARLEPHLAALEEAGVEWEIRPIDSVSGNGLANPPEVVQLVCESGSTLARYRGALPAPLLILLNPETPFYRPKAGPLPEVDWLAPRLHRGF